MQASFLTQAERDWVEARNTRLKQHQSDSVSLGSQMRTALLDARTWHLTAILTMGNIPK